MSTRYTVLQASKYYHPRVGGIEKVVQQLAEGTSNEGVSHHVLAAGSRFRGETYTVNDVPVRCSGSLGTVQSVPLTPSYPVLLRQKAEQAELVHYHLPNPVAVASHFLLNCDTSTVVTYHSDIVRQKRAFELYRPLLHRFLDDVDRIVTTSPRLLEESSILAEYQDKSSVIPLAIDLNKVNDAQHTVSSDKPFVLFVGRLSYYKGLQYLVEAATEINASIGIVGGGDLRTELEERALATEASDRIKFFGRVPNEQLSELYRRADVFVLPSVAPSEAFGIVQLEAMAHRTPVVNTDLSTGVPWVSKNNETGLTVPPGDSNALATAIRRLLNDDDLRKRLGDNARKRVESLFTEQQMLEQYVELYDELLRGN